jgi:hypothetical protein
MSRENSYAPSDTIVDRASALTRSLYWALRHVQLLVFAFLLPSGLSFLFIAVDAEMRSRGLPAEIPLLVPIFEDGTSSVILSVLIGFAGLASMTLLLILFDCVRAKLRSRANSRP